MALQLQGSGLSFGLALSTLPRCPTNWLWTFWSSATQKCATLKDEYLLDALLHTWGALADVYGRAASPADREVARLLFLDEAGHALIMAQGMGYPGEERLLRKYWVETELLDLSRIRKGTSGFKDVGKHLEYIKRQRKDLPKRPAPAQAEQQPQSKNPVSVQGKTPTPPVNQRANTSSPIQGRDRLPVLCTEIGMTTGTTHCLNGKNI